MHAASTESDSSTENAQAKTVIATIMVALQFIPRFWAVYVKGRGYRWKSLWSDEMSYWSRATASDKSEILHVLSVRTMDGKKLSGRSAVQLEGRRHYQSVRNTSIMVKRNRIGTQTSFYFHCIRRRTVPTAVKNVRHFQNMFTVNYNRSQYSSARWDSEQRICIEQAMNTSRMGYSIFTSKYTFFKWNLTLSKQNSTFVYAGMTLMKSIWTLSKS